MALVLPTLAEAASKARPRAFASCEAVGDYARKHALRIVGPSGLPVRFGFAVAEQPETGGPREEPTPMTPQEGAVRDGDGVDYSTTNVQEEGVDEPDIVKTDGKRLYAMAGSTLYVFDIRSGEPELVGSLTLKGYGHELLVSGDRVLALTTYWDDPVLQPQPAQEDFAPYPYPYPEPATRLFEIDVSQAAAPKLLNTLTVEGSYVSARIRDGVARVVIATPPSPWPVDENQRRTIRADAALDVDAGRRAARSRARQAPDQEDGRLRRRP